MKICTILLLITKFTKKKIQKTLRVFRIKSIQSRIYFLDVIANVNFTLLALVRIVF